jgi:hypothetical protein
LFDCFLVYGVWYGQMTGMSVTMAQMYGSIQPFGRTERRTH